MNIRISVVIAVYNGHKFFKEQLESIIFQSKKVDEIIIIDDCSTEDNCDSIINECEKIAECKIIYLKHNFNKGYARTFFEALQLTDANFIFLADQDDIWAHDKVSEYIDVFLMKPEVTCLSSLNILIDCDGKEIKKEKKERTKIKKYTEEDLISQRALRPGMTLAIRDSLKKALNEIDTSCYAAHDRLIEYISVLEEGYYCLQKYLSFYRIHNANTSGVNLSYCKLRTNKAGRIHQIDLEVKYLNQISTIPGSKNSIIQKYKDYYLLRKNLLNEGSVLNYIVNSMTILDKYLTYRIWGGDLLSIVKEKIGS